MYVSLHNQTEYSILDAISSVKDLFNKAKELNMPAIAITEHSTFASIYEAFKESKKTNVKLIVGCEYNFSENKENLSHIILIAKNKIGYESMLQLSFKAYQNGIEGSKKIFPVVNFELLKEHSEGIICLTACGNGILCESITKKDKVSTNNRILKLKEIYKDDLYVEVLANNMKRFANGFLDEIDQQFLNKQLINLAKTHNVKIIASSNSHYVNKEDYEIHDAALAIGSHQSIYSNYRIKYNVNDFYLKSEEEMIKFFSRNYGEEFAKEIVNNTIEVSDKCEVPEWILPKYSNPSGKELPEYDVESDSYYPQFVSWIQNQSEEIKSKKQDVQFIRFKTYEIAKSKIDLNDKKYIDRIETELDVFEYCGVSSYMLIVADYVDFCIKNNVSFGPGRGSCGGSLVNYILGIHNADPIKYGLVFERFHNKKKASVADIDLDFSQKDRHKVLEYISKKYGKDNVAHVSNLIKLTPKVYVRDMCRVFETGGDSDTAVELGNLIADTISNDIHSIDDAIKHSPLFNEYANKYKELKNNKYLCNKPRAFGTHAAGVIIGKRKLSKIVPLRIDKSGAVALEFDKDLAEENGLVKMDILGLSTLDIIDETKRLIAQNGKTVPKINIEEYDKDTYDLISSGNTFGVFQFGTSAGTIELCKKLNPKSIEDLAVITTLARPAAKDIREAYIEARKTNKTNLYHKSLDRALSPTFGYLLYDESLLTIAKDVAGWDLDEADKLRKLTKEKGKNPEKVKKWRQEFVDGGIKNGLDKEIAEKIWDSVVSNAGAYTFNKSHAVLYSMISYETAYLKAHYPIEFLMANLVQELSSNAPTADENILKIKQELRSYGVNILPPNINQSDIDYKLIVKDNKYNLLTGFKAIKFVGDDAILDIIEKRPFNSFIDFMDKVDSSKVRANAIQALAASGCFDSFGLKRKNIFQCCGDLRKSLTSWKKKHSLAKENFIYKFDDDTEWSVDELYALENHYMGEAFICKPYKAYKTFFQNQYILINHMKEMDDRKYIKSFKFIIKEAIPLTIKKEKSKYFGMEMYKMIVEDSTQNTISVTIFPDKLNDLKQKLKKIKNSIEPGVAMHIGATINKYNDEVGLIYDCIYELHPIPQLPKDIKEKKKIKKDKDSLLEEIESELDFLGKIDIN